MSRKFLLLCHNMPERGSWFRVAELARRLVRWGHRVLFVYTSERHKWEGRFHCVDTDFHGAPTGEGSAKQPSWDECAGKILMVESPKWTLFNDRQEGWSVPDLWFRLGLARREKWDVAAAFCHKPNCLFPALAAGRGGATTVYDWVDWWGGAEGIYQQVVVPSEGFQSLARPIRWWRRATFAVDAWLEHRAAHWCEKVCLISEEYYTHPKAPRDLRERSRVFHSGADTVAIRPMDRGAARARLGWDVTDEPVLGYLSSFHGAEQLLLEALRLSAKAHAFQVRVAGAPMSTLTPEQHAELQGRLRHVGRIQFGVVPDFLAACDVLLLPLMNTQLDRARYPQKLGDYVAAGRALVVSDVGETGRIMRRVGLESALAEPNAAAWSAVINRWLEDGEARDGFGEKARLAAEREWDWDGIAGVFVGFVVS